MQRVFAIGDIHGCCKTFRKLLVDKIGILKSDKVYCLGDYVDRGPDSKGVIDLILSMRKENYHIHTIRGNHEKLMLNAFESHKSFEHWVDNGGEATLDSFGIENLQQLPPVYKTFLQQTKYYIETPKYIFVHAGLNLSLQDPFTDKEFMLWDRKFEYDAQKLNGKLLVHGHTPKDIHFIFSQSLEGAINLDGGCVYNGYRNLAALNITEGKFLSQPKID